MTKKRDIYCLDCGKILHKLAYKDGNKRCKSCAAKGKNNANYKHGKLLMKVNCEICGVLLSKEAAFQNSTRCRKCQKKGIKLSKSHIEKIRAKCQMENNPNWKGGKSFEPYPLGWNVTFKEQIRYRDGYKCQLCGKDEIENKRKLDVHHIDYNKINISLSNLISLCKSCHTRTNCNREYWRNKLCLI